MSEREKLVEDAKDAILAEVPIGYGMTKDEARNYVRAVFRVAERTHALVPVEASEGEIESLAKLLCDIEVIGNESLREGLSKGYLGVSDWEDDARAARQAIIAYHRKTEGE